MHVDAYSNINMISGWSKEVMIHNRLSRPWERERERDIERERKLEASLIAVFQLNDRLDESRNINLRNNDIAIIFYINFPNFRIKKITN